MQERIELIELLLSLLPDERAELISRFESRRTSGGAGKPRRQKET